VLPFHDSLDRDVAASRQIDKYTLLSRMHSLITVIAETVNPEWMY